MLSGRWTGLAAAILLLTSQECVAAAFTISPTRVELADHRTTASIVLRNRSQDESVIQVEAFNWEDKPDIEGLAPSRDLIAVPAVFRLEGGASQVIRVRARTVPDASERAFRLVVSEVPDETPSGGTGVQFALRLNLPVFLGTKNGRAIPLWSREVSADGTTSIELSNNGNAHLRVRELHVADAAGRKLDAIGAPFDILAGKVRRWPLDPALAGRVVHIEAQTSIGPISVELAP
ncbi:MAG: fimbria/pilus periplasmic chaperone [Geminicoccaceae bacterium]